MGLADIDTLSLGYAADSWDIERRVITRLEHGAQGNNPRFVVTNLAGDAIQLCERLYCARGEAENRIKEAQLDLFGTRATCQRFAANQLRVLLAAHHPLRELFAPIARPAPPPPISPQTTKSTGR